VEAIDPEDLVEAIEQEDLAEAGQIVRGAATFRGAAVGETGMHLEEDREATADQAHARIAAEVPPAWEAVVSAAAVAVAAEAAAAAVVAVDGGGRHGRRT
jgi:hypothetical protein